MKFVLKGQKQGLTLLKCLSESDRGLLSLYCLQAFLCKMKQRFQWSQSYWFLHCDVDSDFN